jgi:hypothetical protein
MSVICLLDVSLTCRISSFEILYVRYWSLKICPVEVSQICRIKNRILLYVKNFCLVISFVSAYKYRIKYQNLGNKVFMSRDCPFNTADQKIIFWQILEIEPRLQDSNLAIGSASTPKEIKAGILCEFDPMFLEETIYWTIRKYC